MLARDRFGEAKCVFIRSFCANHEAEFWMLAHELLDARGRKSAPLERAQRLFMPVHFLAVMNTIELDEKIKREFANTRREFGAIIDFKFEI